MNILFLTRYDEAGASSRVRAYQFIPYLKKHDITFTFFPLFDEKYIKKLYAGKGRSFFSTSSSYLKRFFFLLKKERLKKFDLLFIEKELFPYIPALDLLLLRFLNIPYILDYDDAIFHNYDKSNNIVIRFLLKNKIKKIMLNSVLVLAGNQYLADYALVAGARQVQILPSVVDLNDYNVKSIWDSKSVFKIGWIGSPSTQHYLNVILPALKKLAEDHPLELITIGATPFNINGLKVVCYPWNLDTQKRISQELDVGIMPLENTPWELGKCAYKLIQYMVTGLPVIASAIGANNEIVQHEKNGFLAKSNDDWVHYIKKLIENRTLCIQFGKSGRLRAEQYYSLQHNAPILIQLLNKVYTQCAES